MRCFLLLQSLSYVGWFVCPLDVGAGNSFPLASGARGTWQDSICLTKGSAFFLYRKDFEMSQLNSRIEDGQVTEAQLQKKIKELQV